MDVPGSRLPVPSLRSFELLSGDTLPSHSVLVFHDEPPVLPSTTLAAEDGAAGGVEAGGVDGSRENDAPYGNLSNGDAGALDANQYKQDFQAYRHQQYAQQQKQLQSVNMQQQQQQQQQAQLQSTLPLDAQSSAVPLQAETQEIHNRAPDPVQYQPLTSQQPAQQPLPSEVTTTTNFPEDQVIRAAGQQLSFEEMLQRALQNEQQSGAVPSAVTTVPEPHGSATPTATKIDDSSRSGKAGTNKKAKRAFLKRGSRQWTKVPPKSSVSKKREALVSGKSPVLVGRGGGGSTAKGSVRQKQRKKLARAGTRQTAVAGSRPKAPSVPAATPPPPPPPSPPVRISTGPVSTTGKQEGKSHVSGRGLLYPDMSSIMSASKSLDTSSSKEAFSPFRASHDGTLRRSPPTVDPKNARFSPGSLHSVNPSSSHSSGNGAVAASVSRSTGHLPSALASEQQQQQRGQQQRGQQQRGQQQHGQPPRPRQTGAVGRVQRTLVQFGRSQHSKRVQNSQQRGFQVRGSPGLNNLASPKGPPPPPDTPPANNNAMDSSDSAQSSSSSPFPRLEKIMHRQQQQQKGAAFDDGFDDFDDFEALEKELDTNRGGHAPQGSRQQQPVQQPTSAQDADFYKILQSSHASDRNVLSRPQEQPVARPSPQALTHAMPYEQQESPNRYDHQQKQRQENLVNARGNSGIDEMRKSKEDRRHRYQNLQQQKQQQQRQRPPQQQPQQASKFVRQRFGNANADPPQRNRSTRQAAADYSSKKRASEMEAEIESRVTKMVSVKVKRLEEEISRYKTEAAKLRSAKVTLEASMLALKEERQAFEARLASADQEQAAKAAKDRERLKKERRVMERQVRAQLHMPNRKDRMEMEALQATIAKMKVTAQKKEGRWKVTERRMKDRIDTLGERVAELESSLKFSHAGQQQQQRRIEQLEHEAQELETRNRMQEFREIGRASGGGDGGKGKGDLVMQNHEMLKEMYPDSNDLPVGAAGMDFDRAQAQDKDDASNATGPQESLRQQYLEQQALMRLKRLQQKGQQQQQQQQHEKAQPSIVDVSLSDHHKDVVIDQNRKVAAFHESIEKETASSGISGYRTPYNPEAYDTGNDDDEEENVQDTGTEDEQTYFRAGQDSERWNQADGMAPKLDFDYSSVGNNRGIAGLESSGARPSDQTKKNMSNEKVSFYADTLRRSYGSEGINDTRASRGDRVDVTSERNDVMQGGRESLEGSSEGQDVPDGEDSGQLIVYEDGKRERRFKSGRRQLWFRNGTEKEIGSDGSATVRFANGDIKKTHTDTGLVVYFYASANTTHTTYGNGVEIFEFPNGQTEKHHPNGLKEISFADKTRKVVYPNGDQLSIFPDGKTLRETKDGTIISSDADSQSKN